MEVIDLIKACKDAGLRQFEGNGIKLSFDAPADPKKVVGEPDPEAERRALETNEVRIKQEQLEELKISDPYLYEQIIAHDSGPIP